MCPSLCVCVCVCVCVCIMGAHNSNYVRRVDRLCVVESVSTDVPGACWEFDSRVEPTVGDAQSYLRLREDIRI